MYNFGGKNQCCGWTNQTGKNDASFPFMGQKGTRHQASNVMMGGFDSGGGRWGRTFILFPGGGGGAECGGRLPASRRERLGGSIGRKVRRICGRHQEGGADGRRPTACYARGGDRLGLNPPEKNLDAQYAHYYSIEKLCLKEACGSLKDDGTPSPLLNT